jgi:hypothetical protein
LKGAESRYLCGFQLFLSGCAHDGTYLQMQYYVGCNEEVRYNKFGVNGFTGRKNRMNFNTHLWIEDRKGKSGYIFWEIFMKQLCPEVLVESKNNNSELVKAVKELEDTENRYIIVF